MFPVQNGLICWLDAMDGKVGDTLLKDRTSYGHNLIVENFQQGYGFTGTSIKVKQSKIGTSNNNALYIANGGFKTSCKSFCICIERHNTNQPWYIFDGRGLNGQGLSTNHCFNGNTGSSYDNSKTRRDGVLTYNNSNLDINKKTFLYFELKEAELFTLSILMRCSKNENTEGEFYSLYAYNRALTEEEILQNMEYENNKISYVNENNLPKIVDKLSNASNIKITGNKYGNRVQTVVDKIVEKADDVTKAIKQEVINNSYSFKVGTGDVDVSTDVEDGFGEVGIKGVTYQNLAPKGVALCDDASKFTHNYLHVTVTQQNGFVQCVTNQEGYCVLGYDNRHYNNLIQPNKCYITLAEVEIIKDTSNEGIHAAIPSHISYKEKKLQGEITKGVIAKAFKTNSDVTTNNNGWLAIRLTNNSTSVGDGFKCYYVSLFEISEAEFNNLSIDELIERYNYKCEGIVGVGDKSKNLLNPNSFKSSTGISMIENQVINIDVPTDGGQRTIFEGLNLPAGTYRVTTKVLEGEYTGGNLLFYDSNGEKFTENRLIGSYTINATNNNINKLLIWAVKGICKIRIQLEKGSSETPYEPYYDGHKIEILSNGKNLSDNKFIYNYAYNGTTGIVSAYSNRAILSKKIPFKANEKLYFYIKQPKVNTTYFIRELYFFDNNGNFTGKTGSFFNDSVITMPNYDGVIGITILCRENGSTTEVSFTNEQVELLVCCSDVATQFEQYQEDKIQILLDEPLMRLPNGVCDEITRDGKLIRRVGKIVFDGTENWTGFKTHFEDFDEFSGNVGNHTILQSNSIVNNFPQTNNHRVVTAGNTTYIRLPKGRVNSLNECKQLLSENPTIVYYELSTPIITELPAPYLRIFKDGHLTFNTLVAPESNHVVQLNKSGQIQNTIKESQSLDNRINVLENNYDNLMLSTISRLNDLEFDYTLK